MNMMQKIMMQRIMIMTNELIILMVAIPVVIAIVAMCIDVGDR